ncbi:hypothetical protein F4803DRAFT_575016 [Xylaria telfairii]|nr:hypothetical protein F4803DRAFT_575016 [Xylaria telfairii]
MSQGYKANSLARVLNGPEEQPRAIIPISRLLNPLNPQSGSVPLSQLLNPLPEQANLLNPFLEQANVHQPLVLNSIQHRPQLLTPSQILLTPISEEIGSVTLAPILDLAYEDPELIPDSPLFNPTHDVPRLTPRSPTFDISHRAQHHTPHIEGTSNRHIEQRDLELVAPDQTPTDTERSVATQIAEAIVQGLQSNAEVPRAQFLRNLDPNRPPLEMADILWERSRCEEDPKPDRWVYRFYSSCMRQVLRQRGLIPLSFSHEDTQKQNKDRWAGATDIINRVADTFGDGVYAGLAINNVALSKLFFVKQNRHPVVERLLATELGNILSGHANKSVRNPAAVISVLWKEEYVRLCRELKLLKRSTEPFPLDRPFDGPNGLMQWDELVFPTISDALRLKIATTTLGDTCKRKRYFPHEPEVPKPRQAHRVYMISRWSRALEALASDIEAEMCPTVELSFREPLRFLSTLMLIDKGGINCDSRACVNLIVPIRLKKTRNLGYRVQLDTGPGSEPVLREWLPLEIVTMEGNTRIRLVDQSLAFFWVRWYQRQHWPWLDNELPREGDDQDMANS